MSKVSTEHNMQLGDPDLRLQKPLEDYIGYFEKLSPRSIRFLEKVAESQMAYKNPFHDVIGRDTVEMIFEKIFHDLENPKIKITDYGWSRFSKNTQSKAAYLKWNLRYERAGKKQQIEGVSEIGFSKNAKVLFHYDYWDAMPLYEDAPLLGHLIKYAKKKGAL